MTDDSDRLFAGSIPEIYETHLVPLIFDPYATDLAERLRPRKPSRVLELAAGTGVVTRAIASGSDADIVATDLNQEMIDRAQAIGTSRSVEWRQADALALPFPDASFDAVVCVFGFMFFPDKAKAFSEARRVLASGGVLIFSVWDEIVTNEFADVVSAAVAAMFPDDPPGFLPRTPYGYFDRSTIERDVAAGGFASSPRFETVAERSRAWSPDVPAIGFCQGTPLRNEIEARDAARLDEATDRATEAVAERFGTGPVDAKIQALIVTVDA